MYIHCLSSNNANLCYQSQAAATAEEQDSAKKPRRSTRLSQTQEQAQKTPVSKKKQQLPSPITHQESTSSSEAYKEGTATPPEGRPSQLRHRTPDPPAMDKAGLSSPPQDTQVFSQFAYPTSALSEDVKDETEEGVWGYLLPLDQRYGKSLVMRKRTACPMPGKLEELKKTQKGKGGKDALLRVEDAYEATKLVGIASGGYLIGRHPECGKF